MSEFFKDDKKKKEIIKDIIQQLHKGLSPEEAKKKLETEAGNITTSEIAEVEQSLINEGMAIDEIKKFCNVHALLFEDSLSEIVSREESTGHPINTFKLENRKIEEFTGKIKEFVRNISLSDSGKTCQDLKNTQGRIIWFLI